MSKLTALATPGANVTFEQREAALYALPRLMSRNLGGVLSQVRDPGTRLMCVCEQYGIPTFWKILNKRHAMYQCSNKGGEHVRWPEDIAGKAARLKELRAWTNS